MFRKRLSGSRKYNEARAKFAALVVENVNVSPDFFQLPNLRRRIIIEDFDTGETVRHEIELFKTNRIDCYRAVVDGKQIASRLGWSKILERIRKGFYRI